MRKILISILFIFLFLSECHSKPVPKHLNNICEVFQQYPQWYWITKRVRHCWGIPISVQMAIVYQESHFKAYAEPPRRRLLGIIPWFRPTTATGYAQAVDETWRRYLKAVGQLSGDRSDFNDAVNFIGWYANLAHHKLGISKTDTFALYIAYHEGIEGYREKIYRHNKELLSIAHHVAHQASIYQIQLLRCEQKLPQHAWWL